MTCTIVIPHFFVERIANLPRLVQALQGGSHSPSEILVWNNDRPFETPLPSAVSVIQSPRNVGCQGRFLAALMARSEVVVSHDNDLVVEADTIANLLAWSARLPDAIVALEGRIAHPDVAYRQFGKVRGDGLTAPQRIDLSLGRLEAIPRRLLPRLLAHFAFAESTVMDDLWLSACARRADVPIYAVPYGQGAGFQKLPTGGVGLSTTNKPTYYQERTRVYRALEASHVS